MGHTSLMGDNTNPRMGELSGQIGPSIMFIHMRPKIRVFLEQRGYRLTEFYSDMFGTDVDIVVYKYAFSLDKTFDIRQFALMNAEDIANYMADTFDKMIGNVEILPPLYSPLMDDEFGIDSLGKKR